MLVINEFLKEQMIVTSHAVERWDERAEGGGLAKALGAALPYGGQFGDGLLLLHNDMVFVTRRLPAHRRKVVTCLTRAQSIANMQANGHHFAAQVSSDIRPSRKASGDELEDDLEKLARSVLGRMTDLATLGDEDLAALYITALNVRHEMKGKHTDGLVNKIKATLPVFQAEYGRRNSLAKYRAASDHANNEYAAFRRAAYEFCDGETLRKIFDFKASFETLPREQWPPKVDRDIPPAPTK